MILIAMLQLGAWQLWAQANLVPNPSFELNVGCPTSNGQIQLAEPWIKIGGDGALSYFNNCGQSDYRATENYMGYYGARTGNGGSMIILLHANHVLPFIAEGNFIGAPLGQSLITGKLYRVRFFLSLSDFHRYASKNVGAHISTGQPPNNTSLLLSLIPQVRYNGNFLTDKIGWMKIEGEFIADGGENFLTIGNFDGYTNSDTLNLHEGGTVPSVGYWEGAQYYIDDVSVTEVDTTIDHEEAEEVREPNEAVGVREHVRSQIGFSVFPNPATDQVNVSIGDMAEAQWRFELYTPIGQLVQQWVLKADSDQLNIKNVRAGPYYWRLYRSNVFVKYGKLVIVK